MAYDPDGLTTNEVSTSVKSQHLTYRACDLSAQSLNRLTNMVDGVGRTTYTYFAGGQLQSEDGPWANDTVTNGYANRLRTSLGLQQPTGIWTNGFAYDAGRRLTNVVSPTGSFTNVYSTGVAGNSGFSSRLIRKLLLPNQSAITNDYDSVARLLSTTLNNSSSVTLDSYAYLYNPADQRTNLTRTDASTVAYRYDKIGQLTVADSTVNAEDRGYVYDAAWNLNRLTNNAVVSTFNVDGKNQLTTDPSCQDGYDSNGNLTSRECGTARGYSYDDENRLTSVSSGSIYRSDFSYDGRSRLRVRTEYTWNGTSWVVSAIIRYIYDGNRVIQERNSLNTPAVAYTRGNDLSGSLEGAGGIGGLLARSDGYSAGNWTNHNFYFADGNANIAYMINSSQAMVASYRYDPFGNTISSSGSLSAANVYRFSSKEIHVNSGMYYYLYRFYDPNLQRWINRDPISDYAFFRAKTRNLPWMDREALRSEARGNHYLFVGNKPTISPDPEGLESWIPFYNPGGDKRPIGVPTVDMPCARAIKEAAQMIYLGNNGVEGYPAANDDDRLQHCITSCNIARACGRATAWALGQLKETNDLLHGGSAKDTDGDQEANKDGRNGVNCPAKSCEDYCQGK